MGRVGGMGCGGMGRERGGVGVIVFGGGGLEWEFGLDGEDGRGGGEGRGGGDGGLVVGGCWGGGAGRGMGDGAVGREGEGRCGKCSVGEVCFLDGVWGQAWVVGMDDWAMFVGDVE